MPQILLEYTENLRGEWEPLPLLEKIHREIAAILHADEETCKSRVVCHREYRVGNGSEENAYVLLTIELIAGRQDKDKKRLGEALIGEIKQRLKSCKKAIQIRCHIQDLDPHFYMDSL